jgi:hypothetical protein
MKRAYLIGIGFTVICAGAMVLWKRNPLPKTDGRPESERGAPTNSVTVLAENPSLQDEIGRLRTELWNKDEQIRALTARSVAVEPIVSPVQIEQEPARLSPALHACDILDERMVTAPADSRSVREMERELQAIVNGGLGAAKVDSLQCGGSMCKVTLTAESDSELNRSVEKLVERTPKNMFSGSAAYAHAPGATALYFARNVEDLTVAPD